MTPPISPTKKFNPNNESSYKDGIFGVPTTYDQANLIFLPVPWEVTTSYGDGTSLGPGIILQESDQLDLFDLDFHQKHAAQPFEFGFYMIEPSKESTKSLPSNIQKLNSDHKILAQNPSSENKEKINFASEKMNNLVYEKSKTILVDNKIPAVIGGDHSTPYGLIKALTEKYDGNFTILHIDAHHDLRNSYQGYTHSHASIMYNVMNLPTPPKKLVSVGIRDFCEEEYLYAKNHKDIHTFYDSEVSKKLETGTSWMAVVDQIIDQCKSNNIYISCDIDGLTPTLCPNTSTPVPGGLEFNQFSQLLNSFSKSKKKVIGFDLVEVSAGESSPNQSTWDANVGARILYKLSTAVAATNWKKQ